MHLSAAASPEDPDNNPIMLQSFGVELDLPEQTSFSARTCIKSIKNLLRRLPPGVRPSAEEPD